MLELLNPPFRRMDPFKVFLVKLGTFCGERTIHFLNSSVNYIETGQWMKTKGFHTTNRVKKREELFCQIASRIADKKVLYLEFGVAKGDSIRYWSELLKNPRCHLHGFDTFEGLPVDWRLGSKKGAFSTGGQLPQIYDTRVKFFKGLFEETLPHYIPPDHETLVINIDCDLYLSASFVLRVLVEYIRPGTYIYFDEFCDRSNELRAFHDFVAATGKRFELLGASKTYSAVVFECR